MMRNLLIHPPMESTLIHHLPGRDSCRLGIGAQIGMIFGNIYIFIHFSYFPQGFKGQRQIQSIGVVWGMFFMKTVPFNREIDLPRF